MTNEAKRQKGCRENAPGLAEEASALPVGIAAFMALEDTYIRFMEENAQASDIEARLADEVTTLIFLLGFFIRRFNAISGEAPVGSELAKHVPLFFSHVIREPMNFLTLASNDLRAGKRGLLLAQKLLKDGAKFNGDFEFDFVRFAFIPSVNESVNGVLEKGKSR